MSRLVRPSATTCTISSSLFVSTCVPLPFLTGSALLVAKASVTKRSWSLLAQTCPRTPHGCTCTTFQMIRRARNTPSAPARNPSTTKSRRGESTSMTIRIWGQQGSCLAHPLENPLGVRLLDPHLLSQRPSDFVLNPLMISTDSVAEPTTLIG